MARGSRSILSDDDRRHLTELTGGEVRFDDPMSRRTTLKLGGPADAVVQPSSVSMLQAVVRACVERGLPMLSVGGGSNLLVRDGGIRGVVLSTRKLRRIECRGIQIEVEAGVSTGKLLHVATEHELGGVEFLGGVPGSVGGGMIMNAGTYLGEFTDVTQHVRTVRLRDGELVTRDHQACGFRYRASDLPSDEIVVSAELLLRERARSEIEAEVAALREGRHQREPKKVSNAGSTFKNPPGDYAGRLIEAAGLKGMRIGGAECSPAHANWLVNTGSATAAELLALIEHVRARVEAVHGVVLELEVKVIGEDGADSQGEAS